MENSDKQKTLVDYIEEGYDDFGPSSVNMAWAGVLAEQVDEVNMTKPEFQSFCHCFLAGDILPYNWDRKTFMGIKITII